MRLVDKRFVEADEYMICQGRPIHDLLIDKLCHFRSSFQQPTLSLQPPSNSFKNSPSLSIDSNRWNAFIKYKWVQYQIFIFLPTTHVIASIPLQRFQKFTFIDIKIVIDEMHSSNMRAYLVMWFKNNFLFLKNSEHCLTVVVWKQFLKTKQNRE